jgi:hypothetical protein
MVLFVDVLGFVLVTVVKSTDLVVLDNIAEKKENQI